MDTHGKTILMRAINKLTDFLKWILTSEELGLATEDVSADRGGRSFYKWLLSFEKLPPSQEEKREPNKQSGGFLKNILSIEAPVREQPSDRTSTSFFQWLFSGEDLGRDFDETSGTTDNEKE